MSYKVDCPFCERTQETIRSDYRRSNFGCKCGARFTVDNWEGDVTEITDLPRTAYFFRTECEANLDVDEFDDIDDARDYLLDKIEESPRDVLNVTFEQEAVSTERVREVVEEGIHGDGTPVSVSRDDVSEEEIRELGVEPA